MVTIACQKHQFSNIKAIVFDKDGTLENSHPFLRKLGKKRALLIDAKIGGIGDALLRAFGIEQDYLNPVGLMAVGSRHENEIAAAAYIAETGRGWLESLSIAKATFTEADAYFSGNDATCPLFTGCFEQIQAFAKAGLKLAILSSDTQQGVDEFIFHHQLFPYLQWAQGITEQGITKPNPKLLQDTCQQLGVPPHQTLMVGDSPGDIEMAKQAGAGGAIGICWGIPKADHLQNADCAITQLDELKISSNLSLW